MSGDESLSSALSNFSAAHEAANAEWAQSISEASGPGDYIEAAFEYMADHADAVGQLVDDLVDAIKDF